MSRSEQLHDASMDEILASIRKIITDDGAEAPDADALGHAALDDFREAGAALASPQPSHNYMGDLTRALAAAPAPIAADDDIFDEAGPAPAPGYAKRVSDALAEAIRAPQAAQPSGPVPADTALQDDTDLFEPEGPPLEADAVLDVVAPLEDDTVAEIEEEIVAELDDPISLGPEIELVDEPVAPVEAAVAESAAVEAEAPVQTEVDRPEAVVAAAPPPPPPPPPPVLSALVEEAAASNAGTAAEAVATTATRVLENTTEHTSEAAASVVAQALGEVSPQTRDDTAPSIAEAASATVVDAGLSVAAAVSEVADEAATEATSESLAQSLEAEAAALVEEIAAPSVADAAEVVSASADVPPEMPMPEGAPAAAQSPEPGAPLVPDDMMAAMLKPMLKEWLDANMPRIVAKAMGGKGEGAAPES